MKKTSVRKKKPIDEEALRSEYRFDYSKSKPNRFAAKMSKGTVAVVLEPDVPQAIETRVPLQINLRYNSPTSLWSPDKDQK